MTNEAVQRARPGVHAALTRMHDDLVFVKTQSARLALDRVPLWTPDHTAGAIYVVRDPRDVAVSYAAYVGQDINAVIGFVENPGAANAGGAAQVFELISSWSAHARSWAESKGVLLLRSEDRLSAPAAHFARIVRFLGAETEKSGWRARFHLAISKFGDSRTSPGVSRGREGAGRVLQSGICRPMAAVADPGSGRTDRPSAWRGNTQIQV